MLADIMSFSNLVEELGSLSDVEVLTRARKEPSLFAVLVRRYEAPFLRRARTILGSPEDYESLPDAKAEFLEDLSIRNEVLAALAKLPETAARILRLQFIEGKTQE